MNNEFNNQNPDSVNAQPVVQPVVQEPVQPVVQPQPVVAPEPVMAQPQPATPVVDQTVLATNTVQNQAPNGEVLEKPKKKKPIALIIILLLVLLAGAGVGAYFLFFNGNGSSPDKIAKKYIQNLIDKKYDENFDYVYIIDDTFIEKNDYAEFAKTEKKYNEISNKKIDKVEEKLKTETDAKYLVNLTASDKSKSSVEVNLKYVNDKWKVVEENFYIENWEFKAIKGSTVTINGKEVPRTYLEEDLTLVYTEKYRIPAITPTEKTIVAKNNLGETSEQFTPSLDDDIKTFNFALSNTEVVNKAFEYIKNTWNGMYEDMKNNVEISEIKNKYFDESVDIEKVTIYYNDLKSQLKYSDKNHLMVEVIPRPNSENAVYGNDLIGLNFGYKITWSYTTGFVSTNHHMTRYSNIMLKLDGDINDGSFKIYNVTDEYLFSYVNSFTHQY